MHCHSLTMLIAGYSVSSHVDLGNVRASPLLPVRRGLFSEGPVSNVYLMSGFEEIYEQHFGPVFRFALHCVGRRELAEDLTSEAFLALYQHWSEIDPGQLPGWLITVVKNRAVDHWRRTSREELYADSPTEGAEFDSRLGAFLLDSKALKPVHRVCLTLRYVHGFTREEIAKRLGMTDNQVKGTLQYALELLRRESGASRKGKDEGTPR